MNRLFAKLCLLISCALLPTAAWSQGFSIYGQAVSGYGTPAASTPIRVCAIASTGTPCTPLATIYQDIALTQQIPNPTATDANGNYNFFVATPGNYVLQIGPIPGPNGTPTYQYIVTTAQFVFTGTTLPSSCTVAGQLFYQTSTIAGQLFVCNGSVYVPVGGGGGSGNPNPYQTFTNQTLVTFPFSVYGFTNPTFTGGSCYDTGGVLMIPDRMFVTQVGTNEYNYNFGFVGPMSGGCTVNISGGSGSGSGIYCPLTGCTFTGPIDAASIIAQELQGIPNAAAQPGSSLDVQFAASVAALPNGCGKVFIPTGYYPITNPIVVPRCVSVEGAASAGAPTSSGVNAVIAYNGSSPGEALLLGDNNYSTQPFPISTLSNLTILGPTLNPITPSVTVGIHCGGNDPAGLFPRTGVITVTAWSVSGTTVTLTGNNTFAGGETGYGEFTSGPTFLNGQNLTVLSSGLSSTQFQVTFAGGSGSGTAVGYFTPSTATDSYYGQYRTISNVQVLGFGYGFLGGDNCFNETMISPSILQNYIGISSVVNPIDSGENMVIFGGEVGENTYALASVPYSWSLHSVSLDFNGGQSGMNPDIYNSSIRAFAGHWERQFGPFVQMASGVGFVYLDDTEIQYDSQSVALDDYMFLVHGPTYITLRDVGAFSNHPVTNLISSDISEIAVENLRGNANRSDGTVLGYPLMGIQNVFNIATYTGIDASVRQSQTAFGSDSIYTPQTWNNDLIYQPTSFQQQTLFTNFGGSAGSPIKICDGTPSDATTPCKYLDVSGTGGDFQILNNAANLVILQLTDVGALSWGTGPAIPSSGDIPQIGNQLGAVNVLACIKQATPTIIIGHCNSALTGVTCTCE